MFNLNDYETVATRLEKFWKENPDGRIETQIIHFTDKQFIFKASIYKTYADSVPFSTGYAEEIVSAKGVNANSALENCETSAIGRALANGNITSQVKGLAGGKRPSREEMTKVNNSQTFTPDPWSPEQMARNQVHAPEPAKLADGIEIVAEMLQGEPLEPAAPQCKHGTRMRKAGVKNDKPYLGFVCFPLYAAGHDATTEKCAPIWAKLVNGRWILPQEAN